ncbi:hypothetical protein HUW63_22605 [Myxococcus sp. AM001]|uniref:imm11 family protein n=1 Tax=Myxococcus vastator TaxID=2709664 RepID=UPI0013D8BD22|nr:DUF1629 domain-containing protein [Myxococcus vastator]NVJ08019.1 hypothetical protein [Myxococcus sp. AM001]
MPSFFILSTVREPKNCVINEEPESIRATSWRISRGLRMDERFPVDVVLQMDGENKGLAIPDIIANTVQFAIVSNRFKQLLAEHSAAHIEFLSVSIANHKGRIAAKDFFVANVLDQHDCIDLERSDVEQLGLEPEILSGLFRLHVLEDRIPPEAKFFRLKSMPSVILIRDDLRAVIDAAGITGVKYIGMGDRCRIY